MAASEYYQYLPPPGSLPARAAERARRRMYAIFVAHMMPARDATILDVGATSSETYASDNYLEVLYPFKDRITAVGLEDCGHLERRYPGLVFVKVAAGPLPFPDRSFDVVHSSAVLEHVGNRASQIRFISELWRVARRGIFVTTPNRWFPVEFHTLVPLLHWLPPAAFRTGLRILGKTFYAREETLNLMSSADLSGAARAAGVGPHRISTVGMLGWPTNLILLARRG